MVSKSQFEIHSRDRIMLIPWAMTWKSEITPKAKIILVGSGLGVWFSPTCKCDGNDYRLPKYLLGEFGYKGFTDWEVLIGTTLQTWGCVFEADSSWKKKKGIFSVLWAHLTACIFLGIMFFFPLWLGYPWFTSPTLPLEIQILSKAWENDFLLPGHLICPSYVLI